MDAETLAQKARKSISKFCIEECHAFCCRKGYLILKNDEVDLVTQNRKEELIQKGVLKKINDQEYSLNLTDNDMSCPSLKDNQCLIHKNPKRPEACREFPLFLHDQNLVKLSPRCLAVKCNLFYPYICQFIRMGYKLSATNPYADLETTRMVIFEEAKPEIKKEVIAKVI